VPEQPYWQRQRLPHGQPALRGLAGLVGHQQRPQVCRQPYDRAAPLRHRLLRLGGQVPDRQRRLHGALRQLFERSGQPKGHEQQ